MAESNFVDYVKIYCRSGKGGRGSTHMRREKYIPNGGPDGGDGGRGGHVILRGNRNYWTLLHLRYDRHIMAGHGESGSKNRSFGKDGEDKVIEVPCGTVVYNAETGEYICDVTEPPPPPLSPGVVRPAKSRLFRPPPPKSIQTAPNVASSPAFLALTQYLYILS